MKEPLTAPASIPLPSADLITYRFDQLDKQLGSFSQKLDDITNTFATQKELAEVKKDVSSLGKAVESLIGTDNRQQGSIDVNKRNFNIALTVFGIMVGAVTTYLGLHR